MDSAHLLLVRRQLAAGLNCHEPGVLAGGLTKFGTPTFDTVAGGDGIYTVTMSVSWQNATGVLLGSRLCAYG
jgi:hypothetical protein